MKRNFSVWMFTIKILTINVIVQTDNTPTLNTKITFFAARSILSENRAQAMAAIINSIENFSISYSTTSHFFS